jgi:DNA phosphorothioation-associated putative methyltransferase
MLNYVVNVIEDRVERDATLQSAWSLTVGVLVVAARLQWEDKSGSFRPFGDGVVTSARTFQKFFTQSELTEWIESVVGERPMAAAPGICYVFRDKVLAQQFLANRAVTSRRLSQLDLRAAVELHREHLAPLIDFFVAHARVPATDELSEVVRAEVTKSLGSWAFARRLATEAVAEADWVEIAGVRRAELLVYLGLSRFHGRPTYQELPRTLARDIRTHWRSYRSACTDADRLLYATSNTQLRQLAARAAVVGKRTPSALYVHVDALGCLSPVLRLYEGCARLIAGNVDHANILKLSTSEQQVSYLAYPEFEHSPHPALSAAVTVNLARLTVERRSYEGPNPPILHRKEEMVADDHAPRGMWERMTQAEERAGLFDQPERIGLLQGWQSVLAEKGVRLYGHRVVRAR